MSRGSPIIKARVAQETMDRIDAFCKRSMEWRAKGAYTRSELVVLALTEWFARQDRAEKARKKAQAAKRAAKGARATGKGVD